jgi:hypothetical protein
MTGSYTFTIPAGVSTSSKDRHASTIQCVRMMEQTSAVLGHISAVAGIASMLFMNPAFGIVSVVTGTVGWFYGTFARQVCQ